MIPCENCGENYPAEELKDTIKGDLCPDCADELLRAARQLLAICVANARRIRAEAK